jgi:hypothetical protein
MVFKTPNSTECLYYAYNLNEFSSVDQKTGFTVSIKNNVFTNSGFNVNLMAEDLSWPTEEDHLEFIKQQHSFYEPINRKRIAYNVKAECSFDNIELFPTGLFSPGVMGFSGFVPFLECYHGVCSVRHDTSGTATFEPAPDVLVDLLVSNTETIDLTGQGYIEKDHGTNFPKTWVWLQSSSFKKRLNSSFMVSVAQVPLISDTGFIGRAMNFLCLGWLLNYTNIIGFLVILHDGKTGKLHDFSFCKNGRLLHLKVVNQPDSKDQRVHLEFKKGDYRLQIETTRRLGDGIVLPGPNVRGDGMSVLIEESIDAVFNISFFKNDVLIFKDSGDHLGMEVAPNAEIMSR